MKIFGVSVFLLLCLFVCSIHIGSVANADEGENQNRNYLIEKLQKVVNNLPPSDSAKNGIILRLADLLSERARLNSMKSVDGKCNNCISPEVDRKKALQWYSEALVKAEEKNKPKILVQMGHLYQLSSQSDQAIESYKKVTVLANFPKSQGEAYLSIGEIFFKKSDWVNAKANFEKAIQIGDTETKGIATYKLGWSQFSLGNTAEAKNHLIEVLKKPEYMSKSGTSLTVVDVTFHEQVAKDYLVLSARQFDEADLSNVYEFSPEKKRLDNLYAIASDLERTGKKNEALKAWDFLYQKQMNPQDRVLSKAHLANVKLQLGKGPDVLKDFNESYQLISTFSEADKAKYKQELEDTRRLIRSSIVTWNQAEKKSASAELLEAYQGYLAQFGYEKEMSQWAVQVASENKQWDLAWKIHSEASQNLKINGDAKDFENHLLLGVELGEQSKVDSIKNESQTIYLTESKSQSKRWEILYQKAYDGYEKAANENFLTELEAICINTSAPNELRIKSGNLYLDYLASKKRDPEIELKAMEFYTAINTAVNKTKQNEYNEWAQIAQKSILNQSAAAVKENNISLAFACIERFQPSLADKTDLATFYKNKMVLAEKNNQFIIANVTAQKMSEDQTISDADKDYARAKMAQYSDLQFDFKSAFKLTERLPDSILSADKKNLKLSLYSDLIGQNSVPYLKEFVNKSSDQLAKESAVIEIIKRIYSNASSSKNLAVSSVKELDTEILKLEKILSKNNEGMSQVAAYSYVLGGDVSYGKKIIEKRADLQQTIFGHVVMNDLSLKKFLPLYEQTKKMSMTTDLTNKNFQKMMSKDIQARAASLEKMENLANGFIKSKDWTLQVVSLDAIAKESNRFYSEIMSLPMPEGLNANEQSEYMRLIGEKADPYKAKSNQASEKVKEFWNDSQWTTSLSRRLNGEFSMLAKNELNALSEVADSEQKARLAEVSSATVAQNKSIASLSSDKNSSAEIQAAQEQVKSEPFSVSKIQVLKDLEYKKGNKMMVQYLEGRIVELNQMQNSLNSTVNEANDIKKDIK